MIHNSQTPQCVCAHVFVCVCVCVYIPRVRVCAHVFILVTKLLLNKHTESVQVTILQCNERRRAHLNGKRTKGYPGRSVVTEMDVYTVNIKCNYFCKILKSQISLSQHLCTLLLITCKSCLFVIFFC